MAVTGVADPQRLLRNDAAVAGLPISLTKPLGVGVLNNRHKSTGEVFPHAVGLDGRPQPDGPRRTPWPPASSPPPTSPGSACWGTCSRWPAPPA